MYYKLADHHIDLNELSYVSPVKLLSTKKIATDIATFDFMVDGYLFNGNTYTAKIDTCIKEHKKLIDAWENKNE